MATWKKIIVSGSQAELQSVVTDNLLQVSSNQIISSSVSDTKLSGSFSGSFQGDGSGLTGIPAENIVLSSLTEGAGISAFTYNGTAAVTVAVSGAAELSDNTITKWNNTDGKFVNSSLEDNGTAITGATSLQLTGANTSLTGSFTGSFAGDGSALTGLVTVLSGSTGTGDFEVDLLTEFLTIQGTANEIETSAAGTVVTIGLPEDVTIAGDLTVSGDLTVQGDVTTINTTNLLVEDRYILLNSGSVGGVDKGGIIVDGGSGVGKAFILGEASGRWGFTGSLAQDATTATPDAFAAAVVTSEIAEYEKAGNIRISGEDIFIYS